GGRAWRRGDEPVARHEHFSRAFELGIEEGKIEQRVMRNKRRVADERDQVLDDLSEERLVLEELARQAVDGNGFGRNIALRIEIAMKTLPARYAIDGLDAADLHQSVPLEGIKPRGLGIKHDFAHVYFPASAPAVMSATDESPPPLRHCSNRVEDRTHLGTRRLEAARRIHDKIRAAALFVVRHLLGQDRFELFHGHAGAFEYARALHLRRRRYHHHRVDSFFSAGLE